MIISKEHMLIAALEAIFNTYDVIRQKLCQAE